MLAVGVALVFTAASVSIAVFIFNVIIMIGQKNDSNKSSN